MTPNPGWNRSDPEVQVVRSLFVSDLHLGSRHSQVGPFLEMLERFEPRYLYLVGDFIDGWKLKRRWRWAPEYDRILHRLMELRRAGTELFYAPGNHDTFVREFLGDYGVVEVRDQILHTTADGRRFLVMHGDQFDRVEKRAHWLSLAASYAYDLMLSANKLANRLRGKRHDPYALCAAIKRSVKGVVKRVSEFEDKLLATINQEQCDGAICGHIHTPRIDTFGELAYCNTGDWVENCSALVEYNDGRLDLIRHDGRLIASLPAAPQPAERSQPAEANSEQVACQPADEMRRRANLQLHPQTGEPTRLEVDSGYTV